MRITHEYVSAQDQGDDPDLVSKDEWNADHVTPLLASLYISGQNPDTVNPDPVSATQVPDMTISFDLDATTTILCKWWLEFTSAGGGSRFSVYLDGTHLWPYSGGGSSGSGWMTPSGDGTNYQWMGSQIIETLSSGSHTILVKEEASGSTASKTYYGRVIEIWDVS